MLLLNCLLFASLSICSALNVHERLRLHLLRKSLQDTFNYDIFRNGLNNVIVNEHSEVYFVCKYNFGELIKKEFHNPKMVYEWIHNGYIFENRTHLEHLKKGTKIDDFHNLLIRSVIPSDSGVHYCRVRVLNYGFSFILSLYILAVRPQKANLIVFSGAAVDLSCNSDGLATYQKHLTQYWYKNGKKIKTIKLDDSFMSSHLYFPKVNSFDKGTYECHVKDTRRNYTYVTNIISLHVKNVIAFLYDPYFWIYLSSGLAFVCVVSCSYIFIKYRELSKDETAYKALTSDNVQDTENETQNEEEKSFN